MPFLAPRSNAATMDFGLVLQETTTTGSANEDLTVHHPGFPAIDPSSTPRDEAQVI